MFLAPAGSVMERNEGRACAAMAAIIGYDGPEVTAFGGLSARAQHRRAGSIDKDAVRAALMGPHKVDNGDEMETGLTNSVPEGAAIGIDPLSLEDFGLTVEWQMVAELGGDDRGDELFRRQSAETLAQRCAQNIFQPTIGFLHLGQRRLNCGQAGFQKGVFQGKVDGIHGTK